MWNIYVIGVIEGYGGKGVAITRALLSSFALSLLASCKSAKNCGGWQSNGLGV